MSGEQKKRQRRGERVDTSVEPLSHLSYQVVQVRRAQLGGDSGESLERR